MPTTVQFRRGTTAQNNAFTGALGELSVDTDLDVLRLHDGSTIGGFEMVGRTANQTLTNKTIAAGLNTISGLTNTNLSGTAGITNANLANSSVTIGSTTVSLGATSTTLAGLTSVTATTFTGALTGNASTATSAATLTTARNINGVSFNGSANITVTANTTNALTIGTGLSGTSFNGSSAVTIAIDSTVTTLTGTQTLTNKTLTSPRVGTGVFDTNGNEVLNIVPVASAVNELSISNAATGGAVLLTTAGSDANINLLIQTKGTGTITLDTGTGAGFIDLKPGTDALRLYDDDSSHYYTFVTGNRTANYNITLPAGDVTLTSGTSVVTTRSISTTAPLAGGGDLSANRTLSLAAGYGDTQNPYASKTANNFLAAPNGTAGAPTFRAIVAADIPTLNQNTTGSAATLTTGRTIAITGDVSYTSGSFNGSANVTGTATLASVGTAGTYTKVTTDVKGRVTSGTTLVATDIPALDASKITTGIIDAARLPSFVDDVLEFANLAGFPVTGETGKLYVALDTNKVYRWSGSVYIFITSGAVDSVAGKTGVVTLVKADVGLANVDNTADSVKSVASAATLTTARTINGVSFNGSAAITVTANTTNALTIGTGLSGTSFNGSGAVTIAIDSTVATLTGTQTLTNKTISGTSNTLSNIANASLTNSTVTVGSTSIALGATATTIAGLTSVTSTTFVGALTGNASTATTLATTRAINGVNFNGSAAITVPVNTSQKSDSVAYQIPFVTSVTAGNQSLFTDSAANITYNPSTNTLACSGDITSPNFYSVSDERLKSNIKDSSYGLAEVMKLRSVQYDMDGRHEIGLIAQNVEEHMSEFVTTDSNGIKKLDYAKMVSVLVKTVQEQQVQIEELKAKLG
jgi:hypothetical protein